MITQQLDFIDQSIDACGECEMPIAPPAPRRRASAELLQPGSSGTSPLLLQPGSSGTSPRSAASLPNSPPLAPRFASWRALSSKAALARQIQINDGADALRQHSMTQHWANCKILQLLGASVVADAVIIAPLIGRRDSVFEHIATTCPLNADLITRTRMADFVRDNVDKLLEELLEMCSLEIDRRKQNNEDVLEPSDVCSTVRMQMFTDNIETLRLLASLLLMRERRAVASLRTVRSCRQTLCQQFFRNFNERRYGTVIEDASATDKCCDICGDRFTALLTDLYDEMTEDGMTLRANRRCCVVLGCCAQLVCVTCLSKTVYNNSNSGCRNFSKCMYCRAELPSYTHLDAPPSPNNKRSRGPEPVRLDMDEDE